MEPTEPSLPDLRPTEVKSKDHGPRDTTPTKSRPSDTMMHYTTKPPPVVLLSQKSAREAWLTLMLRAPLQSEAERIATKAAALLSRPMMKTTMGLFYSTECQLT